MSCPYAAYGTLRPELEPLPDRMKNLPIDSRGYVVPWFVAWLDGKPEFRAFDKSKWIKAVSFKHCWVCGERIGRYMTFVAGPMCGINRTSAEPPSHLECARWSARNCPFLNNPDMVRRQDETFGPVMECAGVGITRNPGVTMLWTCQDYTLFDDGKGGKLFHMGEPTAVEWYRRGKAAARQDILDSIEKGFPALASAGQLQKGGLEYVIGERDKFIARFLPK